MTEANSTSTAQTSSAGTEVSPQDQLNALREIAADHFDPTRFRFIEAMLRRAHEHSGSAREIIQRKALSALQEYRESFQRTQADAADIVAKLSAHSDDISAQAQALFDACNFTKLRRLQAQLAPTNPSASLTELNSQFGRDRPAQGTGPAHLDDVLRQQEQQITAAVTTAAAAQDTAACTDRPTMQINSVELASGRQLRRSQEKSSARQRVRRAISDCPEGAGPLNPQRLVIRALTTMETLSPDYTNRFMAYVDTLLYLQQLDEQNK